MATTIARRGLSRGVVVGLALALMAIPAPQAAGFSVVEERRGLDHAQRWSMTDNAFVDTSARGLGGGLEYAIDDPFCNWMQPYFADEPTPRCEEIHAAVGQAFTNWAADHPRINFVDVSEQVQPRLATRDNPNSGGAEIDVFASKRFEEHNPRNRDAGAYARVKLAQSSPRGTNGRQLPGGTITGADIVVDTRRCWYIDPSLTGTFAETCSYFPGLMMHEIGHTLGLDHPFENPNYHSGNDPTEPIDIDCENPQQGLHIIDGYDATAIMARGYKSTYFHRQLGQDRARLRPDDLGGREFLYPVCDADSQTDQAGAELPGTAGLMLGIGLLGLMRRVR
ncbi:MAG: hypothetical protein ABEK03_05640 [Candidatus Bipolaricaulia bacterium]